MKEEVSSQNAYLEPARLRVCKVASTISTVVGSGVAICMWDRKKRFGGMCHYLYPEMLDKGKTTVKYGNVAIYALIKIMKDYGARKQDIEAQIFGGADPIFEEGVKETFGPLNIRSAHAALEKYGIKVTSEDTGGHMGRKIAFNTDTNEVVIYKVEKMRKEDWHIL